MPKATVEFECTKQGCGCLISETLQVSYPDFSAERMSDGNAIEQHDVICPECETEHEVETVNGMGGLYATLDDEELLVSFGHEPDDYEEFLINYVPENNTVKAFDDARRELLELLTTYQPKPTSMLSRMIYSQLIATMEAYLSDKLLTLATTHSHIRERLAKNAPFVQESNLKLSDMLLDPSLAEKTFKIALQSILYHDIAKVERLYNIACKGPFFPSSGDIKNQLEAAIKMRHDCVHRNGVDKNGVVHQFTEPMIRDLAQAVSALVDHLEEITDKATSAA